VIVCCWCNVLAQQTISAGSYDFENAATARAKADACFDLARKYAEALKIDSVLYYAERIKEFSQQDNYETGFGKYHLALSSALGLRGRNDESKEHTYKAIKIFTGQKEYPLLGIAYRHLAIREENAGNIDLSRKNFWASIYFLTTGGGDDHDLVRSYFRLGNSYRKTSDYDSAASYYIKVLMLAEELEDLYQIFSAATRLGETFLNLRNVLKAYQYLDYGLKHRAPTTNEVDYWRYLGDYAICLSLMHEFARADSATREFEILTKKFDHIWGWVTLDKIKGIQQYEKQNYPEALEHLSNAYKKENQGPANKGELKNIVFNLGRTEFKMEKYDSAIVHLGYAANLSRSVKSLIDAIEADLLLSESFEKVNKPDSALYYFRRYSSLKESVLSLEKQKMITEVTTRYESEKKEQEIKILLKESEAGSYLLQLRNQQIEKQQLEDEKKSQQLAMVSQQNEINKLDAHQKTLNLDNERKENEKKQAKLKLLEKEAAFQRLLASKQNQQKNIAWTSVAAIMILSSYIIYRYLRRKKLQNQQKVLNERLRISRELHDEVGSTLTGIAMYSYLTKEQVKAAKTEEVEKSLNNIQQSAGEMVGKLNDIVWLVNPEKDSLQKLIERLEEYADNIAMVKNIEVKIDVPDKLAAINLPVEGRRDIYLFCKEAINNAVKYSNASLIELTMKELDNKKIEFLIHDNGKGFDAATVKKGNGLVNMEQRAADINGIFSLQSATGQGTIISLICKIT